MKKFLKYFYQSIIHILAIVALFFLGVGLASKLKLTNEQGKTDRNSRYFEGLANKYQQGWQAKSINKDYEENKLLKSLLVVYKYLPENAKLIQEAYYKTKDLEIANRMLDAVKFKLAKNVYFKKDLKRVLDSHSGKKKSIFDWSNYGVWKDFSKVVIKDKEAIDSAAKICGVEPRMIVTCLVGEQVRMFNSRRELFKKYVMPFNYIILAKNFSFGVTGVKEQTAQFVERNLKDSTSVYYLGKKYRNLFATTDTTLQMQYDSLGNEQSIQVRRLLQGGKHFYSYLYTGLILKQLCVQWKKSGQDISKRPEILATLFNLGFKKSIPKSKPEVGGSVITIAGKEYTFGGLCFEFYYSGELFKHFPMTSNPVLYD